MYDGRAGPQHCEENEEGRLQHVPRQPLRSAQRIPTGHVVFVNSILEKCGLTFELLCAESMG